MMQLRRCIAASDNEQPCPPRPIPASRLFEKSMGDAVRSQMIAENVHLRQEVWVMRSLWLGMPEEEKAQYQSKAQQMKEDFQRYALQQYSKDVQIDAWQYKIDVGSSQQQTNEYYVPSHNVAFGRISDYSDMNAIRCAASRNKQGSKICNVKVPSKVVDAVLLFLKYQEQDEDLEEEMFEAQENVSPFLYAINNYD
jgi:hypothetical protein